MYFGLLTKIRLSIGKHILFYKCPNFRLCWGPPKISTKHVPQHRQATSLQCLAPCNTVTTPACASQYLEHDAPRLSRKQDFSDSPLSILHLPRPLKGSLPASNTASACLAALARLTTESPHVDNRRMQLAK